VLPVDRELTVVVNSPPLAVLLSSRSNLTVIILGGRVRRKTMAAVDDWNLRLLSEIHVDVAFLGANGFSRERGFTTPDPAEAVGKRALIAAARRAVVLADHTKVGNDYFSRFAQFSQVDTLITDSGIDGEFVESLEARGLRAVTA
jgi:DeoR family fructose operon transcriptional repressor